MCVNIPQTCFPGVNTLVTKMLNLANTLTAVLLLKKHRNGHSLQCKRKLFGIKELTDSKSKQRN